MYSFNFERLEVWKKSRSLTKMIYQISSKFPEEEKYGLANQIRRSAISVCSNIAEGSARATSKDQRHFYTIAYSSLMECFNQILLSLELQYITKSESEKIRKETNIIAYMFNNLKASIK